MNTPYDTKAVKVLLDTYWQAGGWKNEKNQKIKKEQLQHGLNCGVLHLPIALSHDEIIEKLLSVRSKIAPVQVGRAFLASLSTRNLVYRSALGSYAVAAWMPEHHFSGRQDCKVCGEYHRPKSKEDLNVLNFERIKWGGVRHLNPIYQWFDLMEFLKLPVISPIEADTSILKAILEKAESLSIDARCEDLEKAIVGLFPSSKDERKNLLEILSFCGIIAPKNKAGFFKEYIANEQRELRPVSKIDWEYPFQWWQGKDGVNWEAVVHYFPDIDSR